MMNRICTARGGLIDVGVPSDILPTLLLSSSTGVACALCCGSRERDHTGRSHRGGNMRIRIIGTLVVAAFLTAAAPVVAVTNGQPDGNDHPWVGVMIQFIPSMPGFVTVCTGAALSGTKVLTAAPCAHPALSVFVSYKSGPPFSLATDFTVGTFHPDPDWCPACGPGLPGFDSHDVAVTVLSASNNPGPYAVLPPLNLVDTLAMGTGVEIIGYGVQGFIRGGGNLNRFSCSRGTLRQACWFKATRGKARRSS